MGRLFRIYSPGRTEKIIREMEPAIRKAAQEYGVPEACLKAIMFRETKEIDLFDLAVDLVVRSKHLSRLLHRRDSSTGYMQIFGFVGVNAVNFAIDNGIATGASLGLQEGRRLNVSDPEDVRSIWLRLNRDREFNLRLAALNVLAAAQEVNGSMQFEAFSPEEMKKVFSRYNANTRKITAYGEEVYNYYLRYGRREENA